MNQNIHLDGQILNLIQNNAIKEQSDLQTRLKNKGYIIPQATLSRRLKKLNIAKVSGRYQIIDLDQSHLPLILNMQISDLGLIVLHTHPGNANSLAYFLDRKYVSYAAKTTQAARLLGTIAGDDTVLLIPKKKSEIAQIISTLQKVFPYLTPSD